MNDNRIADLPFGVEKPVGSGLDRIAQPETQQ